MTSSDPTISKWTLPRFLAQGARYSLAIFLVYHVMGRLQAPDLDIEFHDLRLVDLSGASIDPQQYQGRPIVVQVWSSWCRACMIESGFLSRFADNHPNVVVLGLTVNNDWSKAQAAAKRWGIRYPIVAARSSDRILSEIDQLPTTVLFNAEGECVAVHTGLVSGFELSWYLR